ncbi:MAG: phosphodiester glycosidase family protein [Actinomycetota bacterium]
MLGCLVLAAGLTAPVLASTRSTSNHALTPNVDMKTVRISTGPEEERILVVRQGKAVPDIAPATQQYPMWGLTSTMSANAGAIAGVNGDFGTGQGQPVHTLMIDGELWSTGQSDGMAAAWASDGTRAYIGHPTLRIHAVGASGALFNIQQWNAHAPTAKTIAAYTSRGGSVTKPPGKTAPKSIDPRYCAARLVPSHAIGWNGKNRTSLVRRYTVEAQPEPCPRTPMTVGSTAGAVVVVSKFVSSVPNPVGALSAGNTVKLSWTFVGWPGITDVMGGSQLLVDRGKNVAPDYTTGSNYILNNNPRTSIGINKGCSDTDKGTTCRMYLITVDGRQTLTNWSKGVRLPFLANEHLRAGAWMALNLDGGGSTTMWVKKKDPGYCQSSPSVGGCLVNRPSPSTGERATRTAIVVLPSADTGTPLGLR